MKKLVLYCLSCILLYSCIKEKNRDKCLNEVRFFFTHEHSVEEFDTEIKNDVHFHVYQNDRLVKSDVIPYETIKGGKDYIVRDYNSGIYRIVAWAIPPDDPKCLDIPEVEMGTGYHDVSIEMPRMAGSTRYVEPIGEIFLGEISVSLDMEEDSRHEVSLGPCVCNVYFTLYGADLLTEPVNGGFYIELSGIDAEMNVDRSCGGGSDAIVYRELTYDESEEAMYSNMMGVLPSEDEQYLTVNVYRNGNRLFMVETDEQATAGDVIYIEMTLGSGASVYINGWRVKNARVTYF